MVEISHLWKSFDGQTDILKDINVSIKKGEIVRFCIFPIIIKPSKSHN